MDWIAADDPGAVMNMLDEIERRAASLVDNPRLGRSGRVDDTRELVVHPNYLLVYAVTSVEIRILRVLHAAAAGPEVLQPGVAYFPRTP